MLKPLPVDQLPATDNLLQSALWARFKSEFGWSAHAFALDAPSGPATLLVLARRVGPGASLAYVAHAPGDPMTDLEELGDALCAHLPRDVACIRFDVPWEVEREGYLPLRDSPTSRLTKSPVDVQPPSTVIVELEDDEALLAAMHKKHRYNVRLAAKKAVTVREASPQELPTWYSLYRETAERDRISIHSERYYARLFELAAQHDVESSVPAPVSLHLFLAEYDSRPLAGIIVSHCGSRATYLYGASANARRELMPNYAVQYGAMRHARDRGMRRYDLFGIPPADDPGHPMHGLYRFKTGFGGQIVHTPGCWDLPLRPVAYRLYRGAERVRDYYHHRLRKRRAR